MKYVANHLLNLHCECISKAFYLGHSGRLVVWDLRTLGSESPLTEMNLIFKFVGEFIIFFLNYLLQFKDLFSSISKCRCSLLSSAIFCIFKVLQGVLEWSLYGTDPSSCSGLSLYSHLNYHQILTWHYAPKMQVLSISHILPSLAFPLGQGPPEIELQPWGSLFSFAAGN